MKKLLKWQQIYVDYIDRMTNEEILNEVLWDTTYFGDPENSKTSQERWQYRHLCKEFSDKLEKIGLLDAED